jgi:hypothetical protein
MPNKKNPRIAEGRKYTKPRYNSVSEASSTGDVYRNPGKYKPASKTQQNAILAAASLLPGGAALRVLRAASAASKAGKTAKTASSNATQAAIRAQMAATKRETTQKMNKAAAERASREKIGKAADARAYEGERLRKQFGPTGRPASGKRPGDKPTNAKIKKGPVPSTRRKYFK